MERMQSSGDLTKGVEVRWSDGTQRTFGTGTDSSFQFAGWTPDSRAILVLRQAASHGPQELWSISVSGAEAHDLHFAVGPDSSITLSPDGRRIAYGEADRHWDLRIREAFLGGLNLAQPGGR